ncbi:MAG: uracil-DNA glycosylase, partial [Solirubrobacteraceae bacterium]|nr:uracil-DNA glycosylase [Solirubrobacteraceae bacterium]
PLYHPAAALYTRSLLETLQQDFARLPELLALPAPDQPAAPEVIVPEPEIVEVIEAAPPEPEDPPADQLGLF